MKMKKHYPYLMLTVLLLLALFSQAAQAQGIVTEMGQVKFRESGFLKPTSGLWWNPQESGTGITLAYQKGTEFPDGFIFLVSYHYDPATGEPQWFTLGAPYQPNGFDSWQDTGVLGVVEGEFHYTRNGQVPGGSYQAPQGEPSGLQVRIEFLAPTRARMTWNGVSRNIELTQWGNGLGTSLNSFADGQWKAQGAHAKVFSTASRIFRETTGNQAMPIQKLDWADYYDMSPLIEIDQDSLWQIDLRYTGADYLSTIFNDNGYYSQFLLFQDIEGQSYLVLRQWETEEDPYSYWYGQEFDEVFFKLYFVDYKRAVAIGYKPLRESLWGSRNKITDEQIKGSVIYFERVSDSDEFDPLHEMFDPSNERVDDDELTSFWSR